MTPLTMAATARAVARSPERFRKVWRSWVKAYAFPPPTPVPTPKGERYIWSAEAVEAWKARRAGALSPREATPPVANDENIAAGFFPQVAHHRARLQHLRERRA